MGQAILFETAHVLVRRLTADDVDALYRIYSDAEAMHWVGDGKPVDRDGGRRWAQVTHDNYVRRGYGMSTLVLRATGETSRTE